MAVDEDWLARTHEVALAPELPVIDAHHHLWSSPPQRPGERYLGEDFRRDATAGHHIVGSVFIESHFSWGNTGPRQLRPVAETEAVDAMAERAAKPGGDIIDCGFANAIVGHADFELGEAVDAVLEAHITAAPQRFRGVRQTNTWDAWEGLNYQHMKIPPQRLANPEYRRGLARLENYDLSFDSWTFHTQLMEVYDLATAFPGITIIVNHLGGPIGIGPYAGRRGEIFDYWKGWIAKLATCANVRMKLGGMGMNLVGLRWKERPSPPGSDEVAAATRPYILHAIDCFTPARCMFESNLPIDKEALPATVLWNAFKKISAGFTSAERHDLFCGTAARTYRIDLPRALGTAPSTQSTLTLARP